MEEYFDFVPTLTDRSQIKQQIGINPGVVQQEEKLRKTALIWWGVVEKELIDLPQSRQLMKLRSQLLRTFEAAVRPVGLLDRFKTMGVIVSWWEEAYEVSADLRRLANLGFKGLIESWVVSIKDEVEDEERKPGNKFDLSSHKIVKCLVPEYLQEIEQAEAELATLEQEKEAFELGEEGEADEDGETVNVVTQLESQLKNWKVSIKAGQKRIKELLGTAKKRGSIKYEVSIGADTTALEHELAELQSEVKPVERQVAEIELQLQPYQNILDKLKEGKKRLRQLKAQLVERLQEAFEALSEDEAQRLVLDLLRSDLLAQLERYVVEHRQQVIAAVETWWDKYHVTLGEIEREEEDLGQQLSELLRGLGYVDIN
jgi:DNA repair exonuclease SbcCD ATPase subunit